MPTQKHAPSGRDRIATLLWSLLLLAIAVTPLLIAPGTREAFRLPKTIFFQAMMLVIAGGGMAWLLVSRQAAARAERITRHRGAILLTLVVVAWAALVSALAVQPTVARFAPLTVFCHAVLFVATIILVRGTLLPLAALLVPAALNAFFTMTQALHVWSPIELQEIPHGRNYAMGMLGNPDYIGAYLIVPCVAAIAAAIAFRRFRWVFAPIALLLLAGIFFCQSVTAIGATGITLFSFGFVIRSMKARIALAALLLTILAGLYAYRPTRERGLQLERALAEGRLNDFTSLRLSAFVVAVDMFEQRPMLGVGPGNFGAKYMSHKVRIDERHPEWMVLGNYNFGEVHNDHLQLLAETGVPGYLLFLAALGYVAALSFRRSDADGEHARFARLFAFPAVVGFGVIALGQFPLYLVASSSTALFAAALACVWSTNEAR